MPFAQHPFGHVHLSPHLQGEPSHPSHVHGQQLPPQSIRHVQRLVPHMQFSTARKRKKTSVHKVLLVDGSPLPHMVHFSSDKAALVQLQPLAVQPFPHSFAHLHSAAAVGMASCLAGTSRTTQNNI